MLSSCEGMSFKNFQCCNVAATVTVKAYVTTCVTGSSNSDRRTELRLSQVRVSSSCFVGINRSQGTSSIENLLPIWLGQSCRPQLSKSQLWTSTHSDRFSSTHWPVLKLAYLSRPVQTPLPRLLLHRSESMLALEGETNARGQNLAMVSDRRLLSHCFSHR